MRNLSETSVRKRDKKNNDIKKCNGSEHDPLLIPAAALNEGERSGLYTSSKGTIVTIGSRLYTIESG